MFSAGVLVQLRGFRVKEVACSLRRKGDPYLQLQRLRRDRNGICIVSNREHNFS